MRPTTHRLKPHRADNPHLLFEDFFSCKIAYHVLTDFYLTLRLCPPFALQSKEGACSGSTLSNLQPSGRGAEGLTYFTQRGEK